MAFHNSGRISTDGLVLCLDAGNPRSYASGSASWFDLSTNPVTGSLITGSSFNTTSLGAITLNGSARIDIQHSSKYKVQFPLTVCMIVKMDNSSSNSTVIETDNPLTEYHAGILMAMSTTAFSLTYGDNTQNNSPGRRTYTAPYTVQTGSWYVAVAVLPDSLTLNYYVNGSQISSSYLSGTTTTLAYSTGSASIGYSNDVGYRWFLSGSISQVQIYNRALSAQEVKNNYDAVKSRYGLT